MTDSATQSDLQSFQIPAKIPVKTPATARWRVMDTVFSLLLFLTFNPFPQLFKGADEISSGDAAGKSYLLILKMLLCLLAVAVFFKKVKIGDIKALSPLFAFLLIAFFSVAWSSEPYLTARATFELGICVLLGLVLITCRTVDETLRLIYVTVSVAVVLSLVNAVLFPSLGQHNADDFKQSVHAGLWRGIFIHKNILGQVASLHLAMTVLSRREIIGNGLLRGALLMVSVTVLVKSGSATAYIQLFFAILVFFFIRLSLSLRMFLSILLVVTMPFGLVFYAEIADVVLGAAGRELTLTGRTQVWNWLLAYEGAPWLNGVGFGNFYTIGSHLQDAFGLAVVDAHSGYLELYLTLGVLGLAAFSYLVLSGFAALWKLKTSVPSFAMLGIVILSMWVLNAVTETSPFRPNNGLFACALIIVVIALKRATAARSPTRARGGL